jgi:hypothetical protein
MQLTKAASPVAPMTTELFLESMRAAPMVQYANGKIGPSSALVRAFIKRVEQGDYVGAIAHYYHEDATVQENQDPPRSGRDALLAHEMDLLVRYGQIPCRKVERFAVNGSIVFINWQFELNIPCLGKRLFDEVAMQVWDGDRIRSERFYFDPAQIRPAT